MKKIQRLKKEKSYYTQQYNIQDYLLVKKAANYTRGICGPYREWGAYGNLPGEIRPSKHNS